MVDKWGVLKKRGSLSGASQVQRAFMNAAGHDRLSIVLVLLQHSIGQP